MSLTLTERQTREIETFCQIAKENGALVMLGELAQLAAVKTTERELAAAFGANPTLRSKFLLESGFVFERSEATEGDALPRLKEEASRRDRARQNLSSASRFGRNLLSAAVVVSVSGGNSYLSASEREDIDFFCVTKTNGMWPFMLKALVLARIHQLANREVPPLCFSCVMDHRWAREQFRRRQDPIFARDALTAMVIGGGAAYNALLKEGSWIEEYFPAFYSVRIRDAKEETPRSARATRGGSNALNSFLYFTLGSFLRIKAWALNRRLTKAAWHSSVFVTRIGPGHYIYESNKYRKLRKMYEGLEREA